MKVFPALAPLTFVAIDILGELVTTSRENKYLLVISDRFSKLIRTVPLRTITAEAVPKAFDTHRATVYGPRGYCCLIMRSISCQGRFNTSV